MVFSGSQGFSLVPSGLWGAISRKGGMEITLLPESLSIQTCMCTAFAYQIFTFLYLGTTRNV